MARLLWLLILVLSACLERSDGSAPARHATSAPQADTAFIGVQARGHVAMGVDQYSSSHTFQSLPDGGRISLQRNPSDSIGVAQIRSHMRLIAEAFARGNFELPGFVHDRTVPGTPVMAARRSRIRYTADTLSGGGQVRLWSTDPVAIEAIHQFLAFQRHDHRAP